MAELVYYTLSLLAIHLMLVLFRSPALSIAYVTVTSGDITIKNAIVIIRFIYIIKNPNEIPTNIKNIIADVKLLINPEPTLKDSINIFSSIYSLPVDLSISPNICTNELLILIIIIII